MFISEPYLFKEKNQGEKGKAITEKNLPRHRPNDLEKIRASRPDCRSKRRHSPDSLFETRGGLCAIVIWEEGFFPFGPHAVCVQCTLIIALTFFGRKFFWDLKCHLIPNLAPTWYMWGYLFFYFSGERPRPWLYWGLSVGALLPFSNLGIRVSSFLPILAPNWLFFSYHVFGH